MRTHTQTFKNAIKNFGREISSRIIYNQNGDTIELGNEELSSITPHFESSLLKSVMRGLDIESYIEIPIGTVINFQFGVKTNDTYEYLNFGNYIVKDIEKQEDTFSYKITCYDFMLKSMVDYIFLDIQYPITIKDYISAICNYLGLNFANLNDTFPNYDKEIPNELYLSNSSESLGFTFRDVLDDLAEVTASTICINNNNELELRYISTDNHEEKTVNGTDIHVDDAYYALLKELKLTKLSLQKTTKGNQQFDYSTIAGSLNLINGNGLFVANTTATKFRIGFQNYEEAIPCNFKAGDKIAIQLKIKDNNINNKILNLSFSARLSNSTHIYERSYRGTDGNINNEFKLFTYVFTLTDDAEYYSIDIKTNDSTNGIEIKDVQVEFNEVTDYEEYTGGLPSPSVNYPQPIEILDGYITISVSSGFRHYDVEIDLDDKEIVGFKNYLDILTINNSGNVFLNKKIGKILSYNGEQINTEYISTTGGLDTGATVYYVLDRPETIDLNQHVDIGFFEGENNITTDVDVEADLSIKYLTQQISVETFDEEFLKDVNVNFGEKFGPINTIVLSRSGGSDNIYYPATLPENPIEFKIEDNQIMNDNNRDEYLPEIYEVLNGVEYYANDFISTGICYLDVCDKYNVQIDENTYPCIMFNDEIKITQGLEENIYTDIPKNTNTDYKAANKTDRTINQAWLIVRKNNSEIQGLTSRVNTVEINSNEQIQKTVQLETSVNQLQTDTYTKIEVDEKMIDGSVEVLNTKTGYVFDKNGLLIDKSGEPTKGLYNNAGQKIVDKTGGIEKIVTYNGYVTNEVVQEEQTLQNYEGQTVSYANNFIFNTYLSSKNGRWEDVEDERLGKGIGFFIY